MIAATPKPPYYVVIFTNTHTDITEGYAEMAEKMFELASKQEGFLGMESAREEIGITLSYWKSLDAIKNWKQNQEHLVAQQLGKSKWYGRYTTRIALVERDYSFDKNTG
jgi:heme-degrading monooxygenase HmoA